jgi:hypothetical protein
MLRHQLKIQARVSGRVAMLTAVMLLVTSVAQYVHDKDLSGRGVSAGQAQAGHSLGVAPDAPDMVAEDFSKSPLHGRKISQMIFRIN